MALPRTYDHIFERFRNRVPLNYMRALSKRESNLNPATAGGSYWGLMQVGYNNVLPGFNSRNGTNYSAQDLFNPDINVRIAADLLNRIVVAFGKHSDRNMKENWHNPEFAKLVTAGWNSGYSEAGGLGKVASYLESRAIPVTHDNVFRYAAAAGATKHLQNAAKQSWQRSVVDLYLSEGGAGTMGVLGKIVLTVLISWGAYKLLN
jgi:soluble lytic murein transglycosylase-like protein